MSIPFSNPKRGKKTRRRKRAERMRRKNWALLRELVLSSDNPTELLGAALELVAVTPHSELI